MKRTLFVVLVLTAFAALAFGGAQNEAQAAAYPGKDITLVCPFAPGGGTDALARKMADIAKADLGVNILVVNKPGGSGAVGMGEVAAGPADGYTIVMATVEAVLLPLAGLASFKTQDLAPIIRINYDPAALFVRADSGINSIADLVDAGKKNPGKLAIMVSAYPTNFWLCGAMFKELSGTDFNIIPEPGGAAEEIKNLLGGHVDAMVITPAEGAAYVKSGEFKMLAIASDTRDPNFPDVPLFKEAGYDVVVGTWRGFMAPKNVPANVISILEKSFTKAYQSSEMKDFLKTMGFGEGYLNPADFTKLLDEQAKAYGPVISKYK
jgi:tripartite-type tricarboxylate transporter receptor subunit TctC